MKFLLTISIALFLPHGMMSQWDPLNQLRRDYDDFIFAEEQKLRSLEDLQAIKSFLINGELFKAKYLLNQLSSKDKMTETLKIRYMTLIYFIENRFEEGALFLKENPTYREHHFQELCLLRSLFYFSTNQMEEAIPQLESCLAVNGSYLRKDGLWAEMILMLKSKHPLLLEKNHFSHWFADVDSVPDDQLTTWFKLGLYLNQEKEMKPLLGLLDDRDLQNPELRELVALYYYRLGNWDLAYKLAEDVNTPNAENILGNILLNEKKYELSFGHFQLAQKYKRNSLNSVERGVPLSWLFSQWEEGFKMAQKLPSTPQYQQQKWGLLAAFSLQLKNFEETKKHLDNLHRVYGENLPLNLNLISAHYAFLTGDNKMLAKYSEFACFQFDAASCLLLFQNALWPKLGQALLSKNKIIKEKEFTVNDLKQKVPVEPLQDILYLQQKDIEELDSADFELRRFSTFFAK